MERYIKPEIKDPSKGPKIKISINVYPFIVFASSIKIEFRSLKKHTSIARPIAASAAATVKINIAKTCPTKSPRYDEKTTKLMFTDAKISSIDIRIIIIFFLLRKIPKTPITKSEAETIRKCSIGIIIYPHLD